MKDYGYLFEDVLVSGQLRTSEQVGDNAEVQNHGTDGYADAVSRLKMTAHVKERFSGCCRYIWVIKAFEVTRLNANSHHRGGKMLLKLKCIFVGS